MSFLVLVNVFLLGFVHIASSTPCLPKVGGCSGGSLSESFSETVKSSASSASSMFESSKSSSSSMTSIGSCSSSSFDQTYWSEIFEKCTFFSEVERQCYLKWLATYSESCLTYYSSIANYLSIQEALSSDIVDYVRLQKDILAAYEFFNSKGVYSVEFELATKIAIFEEYKSKLVETLKCLSPSAPLYELLKYSIEVDISSLPCTIGILNGIIKSQESYFASSTSSSSSTRSVESSVTTASSSTSLTSSGSSSGSSGSSCANVAQYESILQAANIQAAEYQVYLSYLSKLSSDKICLFSDLINFLNQNTQVLTTEMILDFASFNQEIQALYQSLCAESFFVENADWIAKETILIDIKTKLSSAMSFLSEKCCMYKALQYCLEQDICYLPLFIGLNHYLLEQQSSFFSMSSSSSSTVVQSSSSSSSCSSIC